jgi:hypothetical protein
MAMKDLRANLAQAEKVARTAYEDATEAQQAAAKAQAKFDQAAAAVTVAESVLFAAEEAERKAGLPQLYRVDVVDRGTHTVSGVTRRNLSAEAAEAFASFLSLQGLPDFQEVLVREEPK